MSASTKTCPACGNTNAAGDIFCHTCGADISHVETGGRKFTKTPSTGAVKRSPITSITNLSGPAQPCPRCGYRNPSFVMLCPHCGADIPKTSSLPEEAESPPSERPAGVLRAQIGGSSYELTPGDVLGREGTVAMKYFSDIGTVSRKHVQVSYGDGTWLLFVPRTVRNVTQLDGEEMPRDVAVPLEGSHRLRLSTKCEIGLEVSAS